MFLFCLFFIEWVAPTPTSIYMGGWWIFFIFAIMGWKNKGPESFFYGKVERFKVVENSRG